MLLLGSIFSLFVALRMIMLVSMLMFHVENAGLFPLLTFTCTITKDEPQSCDDNE